MSTQLHEGTKMSVPKMIETHQSSDRTFRVRWTLPDGSWNQVAFMTPSFRTAEKLTAELKAGLRDLTTGELLDEGTVSGSIPCPTADVL